MVKGIGIDIIEVARVQRLLERDPRFAERLFTEREIAYCQSKHTRGQHFAARFTAKEAFLKALGTGFRGDISWKDIAVENDPQGKPHIVISGAAQEKFHALGYSAIHLSISHTHDYAVSFVVLE